MRRKRILALCLLATAFALHGCGKKSAPDTHPPESSADALLPAVTATETTSASIGTSESQPATVETPAATTEPPAEASGTDTVAVTDAPTGETTVKTDAPSVTETTTGTTTATETSATTEKEMKEWIEFTSSRQNAADYFVSPYRQISHIGDPYVLYDEASGKYYMYCTGGKFRCWSSDTFKSWTELGDAYTVTEKSFGTQNYWAPEVYKWNGAYYMVYSAARKVVCCKC